MTARGPREFAEEVGTRTRENAGKIRRMIVSRTNTALYQVVGHTLLDKSVETRDAEVFQGVGFASRPNETDDTEAIVAFPGGPGNPIIVAVRQEAVRRVVAADLDADETQLHNSGVVIRIKRDMTVEIRTLGGTPRTLAFKDELEAVDAKYASHLHPSNGSGPVSTVLPNPAFPATSPDPLIPGLPLDSVTITGTAVLKAE